MNDSIRTDRSPALINAAAACCLLAVLVFCYHQGFNGPFMLDDISSVLPAQIEVLSIGEFTRVAGGDASGLFGRAIPVISFALNNYFGDGSPVGFKVGNFILHAITAVVVYAVLGRIFTLLNQRQKSFSAADINKLAFFCTAVWTLHPLQISTVLYVVQRMAMLSALFSILALWLFLIIRTTQLARATRAILIALLVVSILAACLSKENGVLSVAYIGFVELLALRFRNLQGQRLDSYRRVFMFTLYFGLVAGIYLLSILHTQLLAGYVVRDYDVWERLMTEPGVLLMYLKQMVLPNISDMSLYHDAYPVVRHWGMPTLLPSAIFLLLGIVSVVLRRKLPILLFGVGFFLISHSIESTFLPLELVFEHRNYLALMGVIAPIFWLLMLAVNSVDIRLPKKLMATAVLILLSFQTYTRSIEWSDIELMQREALLEHPDSIRALNDRTAFLSGQGLNAETIMHLEYSHRIRPESAHFLIQLLMYSGAVNGPNEQLFNKVKSEIAKHPLKMEEVSALQDMYHHYYKRRFDWPDTKVIKELYEAAVMQTDKHLKAPTESLLYGQYSILLFESGQEMKALSAARHAVEIDQASPEPLLQLARLQLGLRIEGEVASSLDRLATLDRYDKFLPQRNLIAEELLRLTVAESED